MNNLNLFKLSLAAFLTTCTISLCAQIVGSNAFLQGNFVEVGISQCGVYGTPVLPPVGYHPNPGLPGIGFVADPERDGWTVGTAPFNYCGDYFVPGSPVEGWALTVNGIDYINSVTGCIYFDVPGGVTGYTTGPAEDTAFWTGGVAGMLVRQMTLVPTDSVYFLTRITLVNTTGSLMTGVYYGRNVDPDNEQPWTGNFTTNNRIVSQPVAGVSSDALVLSNGTAGVCYLGLGTQDDRASVNFGGFTTIPADDLYSGLGRTNTVGSSTVADVAIGLGFSLGDIAPGDSVSFSFVYVMDTADLADAMLRTAPPCAATSHVLAVSACESYVFGGATLTATGTYVDSLLSVCGTDSIVTLNLTIHHGAIVSDTVSACGSYSFNGSLLTTSGVYDATFLTASGCDSIITLHLTIDAPVDLTIIEGLDGTLSAAPGLTYQWVDCGAAFAPIAGAIAQGFLPTASGSYACILTSGACSDTSACTEVIITSNLDPSHEVFSLSPNPADDVLHISFDGSASPKHVEILGINGQVVWERDFTREAGCTIDISFLVPGVYFVKATNGGREQINKLLKR